MIEEVWAARARTVSSPWQHHEGRSPPRRRDLGRISLPGLDAITAYIKVGRRGEMLL